MQEPLTKRSRSHHACIVIRIIHPKTVFYCLAANDPCLIGMPPKHLKLMQTERALPGKSKWEAAQKLTMRFTRRLESLQLLIRPSFGLQRIPAEIISNPQNCNSNHQTHKPRIIAIQNRESVYRQNVLQCARRVAAMEIARRCGLEELRANAEIHKVRQ